MNEEELKIFRKLDDKLYLIEKNNTYKQIFSELDKNVNPNIVQEFIDKLSNWYLVKYPDKYVKLYLEKRFDEIDYTQEELMSFDKLLYVMQKVISFENDNSLLYYKQLIVMAGWGMIYFKKTMPEYGYFRVQKMFEDFNREFGLELNTNIYDVVMNADYSKNNPDTIKLLEQKKEQDDKEKRFARIKKLFRR